MCAMNQSCVVAVFGGNTCETDLIDNCNNNTCYDRNFCRDLIDAADCVCPSDSKYTGARQVLPVVQCWFCIIPSFLWPWPCLMYLSHLSLCELVKHRLIYFVCIDSVQLSWLNRLCVSSGSRKHLVLHETVLLLAQIVVEVMHVYPDCHYLHCSH